MSLFQTTLSIMSVSLVNGVVNEEGGRRWGEEEEEEVEEEEEERAGRGSVESALYTSGSL